MLRVVLFLHGHSIFTAQEPDAEAKSQPSLAPLPMVGVFVYRQKPKQEVESKLHYKPLVQIALMKEKEKKKELKTSILIPTPLMERTTEELAIEQGQTLIQKYFPNVDLPTIMDQYPLYLSLAQDLDAQAAVSSPGLAHQIFGSVGQWISSTLSHTPQAKVVLPPGSATEPALFTLPQEASAVPLQVSSSTSPPAPVVLPPESITQPESAAIPLPRAPIAPPAWPWFSALKNLSFGFSSPSLSSSLSSSPSPSLLPQPVYEQKQEIEQPLPSALPESKMVPSVLQVPASRPDQKQEVESQIRISDPLGLIPQPDQKLPHEEQYAQGSVVKSTGLYQNQPIIQAWRAPVQDAPRVPLLLVPSGRKRTALNVPVGAALAKDV